MIPLIINPKEAIPWHHKHPHLSLVRKALQEKAYPEQPEETMAKIRAYYAGQDLDFDAQGWRGVPPVPLVEAPPDLRYLGSYVLYEGNHRRASALEAGISLSAGVIESEDDIAMLARRREVIVNLPLNVEAHKEYVWHKARALAAMGACCEASGCVFANKIAEKSPAVSLATIVQQPYEVVAKYLRS